MSTKYTRKFVETEVFGLHLYDDALGSSGIEIRINNNKTTLLLSKKKADEIEAQLEM